MYLGVIVKRDNSSEKEELIKGKEVILSAGTIGSVQILLLSGIGPQNELEKHKIPLIVNLPGVGKNLQDHLMTPLFYLSRLPTLSNRDATVENLELWKHEGKGPLASGVGGSQAWFQVDGNDKTQYPDIQLLFCSVTADANLCRLWNFKPEVYEKYLKPKFCEDQQCTVIALPVLLHPKSRGEITLASDDPFVHPIIDPNYLEDKEDVRKLIEACKITDQICKTKPLNSVLELMMDDRNENTTSENQDQFLESYIRKYSLTAYHPIGTCKMGKQEDPMAVVTPDTRVKGVKSLRVVDASIMPTLVSGNANIPTIAVAERAADLIKSNS
ncbi:unnamed protein product [Adineta ricciae]|uniref:Uncharacterized protein n=1 Tax=Adineta ricciae TaxID=249248 RepID=A0A815NV54_ADIRI|nr:unnamed protein product [Adineta ricciae]CAF1439739.1 unnamed protein product [Adineta ricciae]